jgi:hypothetical protein
MSRRLDLSNNWNWSNHLKERQLTFKKTSDRSSRQNHLPWNFTSSKRRLASLNACASELAASSGMISGPGQRVFTLPVLRVISLSGPSSTACTTIS